MKYLIFTFTLLIPFLLQAQDKDSDAGPGILLGKVIDEKTGEPIPFATVVIKDNNENLIIGSITDEKGRFKIDKIPIGNWKVELQYLSYETVFREITITSAAPKVDFGKQNMSVQATELNEVVVRAEKSTVTLKLGKKVFTVGNDVLSQSGTATEVLGNVPSVSVAPDGTVSLRGNRNVNILINGRRSGLTANDALDLVPANTIEKVEVITTPSAQYDAAGTAGIINIILKKNRKEDLTGQIKVNANYPAGVRILPSLNYKKGKINLFSTVGYRSLDFEGNYFTKQSVTDPTEGVTTFLDQFQDEERHDEALNMYIGMDYFINDKNTITAAFFKKDNWDTDQSVLRYDYSSGNTLDSTFSRIGNSEEPRDYNQLEFNYTKLFTKKGQKFTVDMQYDFWNSDKLWNLFTERTFPFSLQEEFPEIRTRSTRKSKDFVMQSDFVTPLNEHSQISMGIKGEIRSVANEYIAEELADGIPQIYRGISNDLDYIERIGGAYLQYESQKKKFSYSIGIRTELTGIEIEDREGVFFNSKNYINLFPSFSLGYVLTEKTSSQLSYSRRINRPPLSYIYPFFEITDFNSQIIGNPDMDPSYSDVMELSFLTRTKKFSINPSIYFQNTTDYFQFYIFQDSLNTFTATPINLSRESRYGFELSAFYSPIRPLRLSGEFNIFAFEQEGEFEGQSFDFSDEAWNSKFTTILALSRSLFFQGVVSYTGPRRNAQTETKGITNIDFGFSKKILEGKATVTFIVNNFLNQNKTREITIGDNYVFDRTNVRNGTRLTLDFVYRINKNERNRERQEQRSNRN